MDEKMKLTCGVAEDLLPLYRDGVCSEESSRLVEEHLEGCANCRAMLERMNYELMHPPVAASERKFLDGIRSTWLRTKKKALLKGAAAAAGAAILLIGGLYTMNAWKFIPVSTSKMEITEHSILSDGTVAFHFLVDDGYEIRHIALDIDYETGTAFLTPKRSILEARSLEKGTYHSLNDRTYFLEFLPFTAADGMDPAKEEEIVSYYASREDWHMADRSFTSDIRKVCLGTKDDHIVLYEEGLSLPAASAEMEAYFKSPNRW